MYYYLDQKGEKIGPVSKETLKTAGITRSTLIFREGWPTWIAAEKIPELADIIAEIPPIPTPYTFQGQDTQTPNMIKPSSYMWLGILTTILCCLPFGIVSIVYASKVDSCWTMGQYDEAVRNSNKAKNWGIASAASALVIGLLYFGIIALAASGL